MRLASKEQAAIVDALPSNELTATVKKDGGALVVVGVDVGSHVTVGG
jgi:hypothetical protein